MTLVAALLFGLISGFVVRGTRRAALAALIPWLAVLGLQTWLLASGRGQHAASTAGDPGYWIIQVIAFGLCVGIAALVASRRPRRSSSTLKQRSPESAERSNA